MNKDIFILAGEASGDLHASILVAGLRRLDAGLSFSGVGGRRMAAEGVSLNYDYSRFTSMGIIEPLKKLRFYRNALENIINHIFKKNIGTVILVDFPGFNLYLAGRLKKKSNVKIIYYISPQIWAWHYSRIRKIKKYVDAMIVLYPFEEEMYRREGVRSYFLGNPIVDIVAENIKNSDDLNVKITKPCIALLPGSRIPEVKRHLAVMIEAAGMLGKKFGGTFLVPVLQGEAGSLAAEIAGKKAPSEIDIHIIYDNTYNAVREADLVICCSGTATLETAILEKPMIIIYRVGILTGMFARILLKTKMIGLVNIAAGKKICPELVQRDFTAERIFKEALCILDDTKIYNDMVDDIKAVKRMLGGPGSIEKISMQVLSLINDSDVHFE